MFLGIAIVTIVVALGVCAVARWLDKVGRSGFHKL